MEPAIEVEGVWKKFKRGQSHDSLKDWIPSLFHRARGTKDQLDAEEFWAVQDLSFQVMPGEALAIIGPNGAGKSTSLKILSRILRPDRGRCVVRGRVGALIEVAAGFHPDLTGRENIFLQGAIMGMTTAETRQRFDAIVDFAGMADFIDTPVKRYSSGMHARLGFAVAAHLDPDVLLIDEVLSVGDMAFQERCVERAKEFRRDGVAIVFVSHNLQAVTNLCDTAVYVHRGVRAYGKTEDVLTEYLNSMTGAVEQPGAIIAIRSADLLDGQGNPVSKVSPAVPLRLRLAYHASETIDQICFGFAVHRSTDGLRVYDGHFHSDELGLTTIAAGQSFTIDFDFSAHLTRGHYYCDCFVQHTPRHAMLTRRTPAALFTVDESRSYAGIANLDVRAKVGPAPRQDATTFASRSLPTPA